MGGSQGQASDIAIQAKEILRMKNALDKILSFHTGQSIATIETDTDRDFFMTSEQGKEYGIIDKVITSRSQILKPKK
jgi:ATP-dependent Clp protease protease subunit